MGAPARHCSWEVLIARDERRDLQRCRNGIHANLAERDRGPRSSLHDPLGVERVQGSGA
jgi:hypothetical protein